MIRKSSSSSSSDTSTNISSIGGMVRGMVRGYGSGIWLVQVEPSNGNTHIYHVMGKEGEHPKSFSAHHMNPNILINHLKKNFALSGQRDVCAYIAF